MALLYKENYQTFSFDMLNFGSTLKLSNFHELQKQDAEKQPYFNIITNPYQTNSLFTKSMMANFIKATIIAFTIRGLKGWMENCLVIGALA